ncbi:MAG: hypothetical protein DRN00_03635 [Thermoplasmata archaeon]|nr:MAG: hypothetical protein DRN00_03635 [Thermoplasmata archaeon]
MLILIAIANPAVASQREEKMINAFYTLQQEKQQPRPINWSYIKCMLQCALKDPEGKNITKQVFFGLSISALTFLFGILLILRFHPISFTFGLLEFLLSILAFAIAMHHLSSLVDYCNEKCMEGQCPVY